MKKRLLACVSAVALGGTPALAADLPMKAPVAAPAAAPLFNWTGCYVGGNAFTGWSQKSFTASDGTSDGSHTADGWLVGGQIGCDYQFANNWVIGIQGMWDGANLTGQHDAFCDSEGCATFHTKISSFATVTAELGYLINPTTKFYGKAGVGWVKDHFTCDGFYCDPTLSANGTRSGFDLGVGIAWMFAPNWDFWVEYDHMWLGSKTLTFTNSIGDSFHENIKQDLSKVLVGVDYRFNWGKAPVVAKY